MGAWAEGAADLVVLPDGRRVRARSLRRPPAAAAAPEFGVYLAARPHVEAWPSEWIAWPDFRLPLDPIRAVEVLRAAHDLARTHRVEVACAGGTGRTGTAVAILARLAGVPAAEAVAWTRAHYRARAVETPWQRRFAAGVDLDDAPGGAV